MSLAALFIPAIIGRCPYFRVSRESNPSKRLTQVGLLAIPVFTTDFQASVSSSGISLAHPQHFITALPIATTTTPDQTIFSTEPLSSSTTIQWCRSLEPVYGDVLGYPLSATRCTPDDLEFFSSLVRVLVRTMFFLHKELLLQFEDIGPFLWLHGL